MGRLKTRSLSRPIQTRNKQTPKRLNVSIYDKINLTYWVRLILSKAFGLPGVKVEIGQAVSTDGGVVFVVPNIKKSQWFKVLVPALHTAITKFDGQRYGFARTEKLERCMLALVAGVAMGYRSANAIADVIAADPLWRRTLGKRVTQPDISRLMGLLATVGLKPLKRALAESVAEGRDGIYLDGDSTLIELHGNQEGSSYTIGCRPIGPNRRSRLRGPKGPEGVSPSQRALPRHRLPRWLDGGHRRAIALNTPLYND